MTVEALEGSEEVKAHLLQESEQNETVWNGRSVEKKELSQAKRSKFFEYILQEIVQNTQLNKVFSGSGGVVCFKGSVEASASIDTEGNKEVEVSVEVENESGNVSGGVSGSVTNDSSGDTIGKVEGSVRINF